MKCCNLRLDFATHGWVCVLMSSRYSTGALQSVWQQAFADAQTIAKLGYDVVRLKIESTAHIKGVPGEAPCSHVHATFTPHSQLLLLVRWNADELATDEEANDLPEKTYFEFHMVLQRHDESALNADDVQRVKQRAAELMQRWNVSLPLSTNTLATQTFINSESSLSMRVYVCTCMLRIVCSAYVWNWTQPCDSFAR
jgi:hypothetical protein